MENNKRLGVILIVLSLIIGGIFIYYISNLTQKSQELGCFNGQECFAVEKGLSISHIAIGIFSFILALGFYLLFFNKERIIEQKDYDISKLNSEEKRVFRFIMENKEKGVYQSSIVEKFNFPKSKVSRILDRLEAHHLIERKRRGMTNVIVLK
ncbi:MAG: MarR family transcriptional regulator [Candidatus Pacearchaeota archaeon]